MPDEHASLEQLVNSVRHRAELRCARESLASQSMDPRRPRIDAGVEQRGPPLLDLARAVQLYDADREHAMLLERQPARLDVDHRVGPLIPHSKHSAAV